MVSTAYPPRTARSMMRAPAFILLLAVLGICSESALADGPAPTKIDVYPPDVNLNNARDRQLVVVQATYADGLTRDVTAEAAITPADPKLLRREGNVFWPAADGKTELNVAFGGQTVTVPVTVAQAQSLPPVSFRLDV